MKHLFSSLLIALLLLAVAQQADASRLRTRISDDSHTLSIQIDGKKDGHSIHLNQRFDVSEMNTLQKEVLKYRTFTSAGVTPPLHELPTLITGTLSLLTLLATLFILRYQASRRPVRPLL